MELALGTAQFGSDYGVLNQSGKTLQREVSDILAFAKSCNIDTIDTAAIYGDSENVLGEVGMGGFNIITKTLPLKVSIDNVLSGFHQSLDKLGVKKVDGLLIHDFNDVCHTDFDSLYKKLIVLKERGYCRKIGFSTYTPQQIDFLLENFDFDLVQVPINVFDQRLIVGGQLKALKRKNIEIHARSIFLQGILLDFSNLPNYFLTWRGLFKKYINMVSDSDLSLIEYAVNFVMNIEYLDKIIVGVYSKDQLEQILECKKQNLDLNGFAIDDVALLNPSLWEL